MEDIIDNIITELLDEQGNGWFSARQLIDRLEHNDLMIVPIEDPTNLRFGVDD